MISPSHAIIYKDVYSEKYFLQDISSEGTYVNSSIIHCNSIELNDNDEIKFSKGNKNKNK